MGLVGLLCAQLPRPASGQLRRHENFPSQFVAPRHVDVWLPEGYSTTKRYAVLYFQDGQMLFDSSITWNKQEWQIDETLGRLLREGQLRDCIVVAISNGGAARHSEYFPQKPFESLRKAQQDSLYKAKRLNGKSVFGTHRVQSDAYLKFLVTELKPFIDREYPTRKGRKHNFVAGSSMGGLIALYAVCEYPGVFGGAACLSTHWPGIFAQADNPVPDAFWQYLKAHLPSPKRHKIYFDHGDQNLDSWYAPLQQQADAILRDRGYTRKNSLSKVFPGADHAERDWAKRLDIPLRFLLGT
jgi:enterochelin esterase-like enzyme